MFNWSTIIQAAIAYIPISLAIGAVILTMMMWRRFHNPKENERFKNDWKFKLRVIRQVLAPIFKKADAPRGLLIDMLMPPDRAEDVLYNLLGRYDHWVEVHGPRWARIIFYLQSAGSIITFWADWLLKRLKLLKMFVSS
jgi:hypothetical protein